LKVSIPDVGSKGTPTFPNTIATWWIEFNTSVDRVTRPAPFVTWVAYVRNFVVLKNPSAGDIATIIAVKPLGSGAQ
jgi:hypothetical protein